MQKYTRVVREETNRMVVKNILDLVLLKKYVLKFGHDVKTVNFILRFTFIFILFYFF